MALSRHLPVANGQPEFTLYDLDTPIQDTDSTLPEWHAEVYPDLTKLQFTFLAIMISVGLVLIAGIDPLVNAFFHFFGQ